MLRRLSGARPILLTLSMRTSCVLSIGGAVVGHSFLGGTVENDAHFFKSDQSAFHHFIQLRKNLFDALRPLQAIQTLNQARVNYLTAVLDFNRAQYRLYAALGYPTHVSEVLLPRDEK